ncbi:hypothetical protein IWX50DRAFT_291052 [Phyllosticta citricarpa]|uniref:T. brucei spp.-specific protein n=1 Tax=Phyllosticta citricarpa TaxID=55181 RepID=A0ABR1ME90_9PEZI
MYVCMHFGAIYIVLCTHTHTLCTHYAFSHSCFILNLNLLTHSLIHSFIHSFIHASSQTQTYSLTHSFIHSFMRSFVRQLVHDAKLLSHPFSFNFLSLSRSAVINLTPPLHFFFFFFFFITLQSVTTTAMFHLFIPSMIMMPQVQTQTHPSIHPSIHPSLKGRYQKDSYHRRSLIFFFFTCFVVIIIVHASMPCLRPSRSC